MAGLAIHQRARRIGYVMQNPNSMITKPMIYDEVALSLTMKKAEPDHIRQRVHEALKLCGLYEMRSWPVAALSYGQKKRVTIASQLVEEPEMLILDEPTAGQDFRNYTRFMGFLQTLNRERGLTLLLITHDMHLMLEYANRCLVLTRGKLLADSTPAQVLSDEELTERASLKRTSLYTLARRAGIEDAPGFIDRFLQAGQAGKEDAP
jgi:energy-coupling factor transport system ATP-binding protein